MLRNKCNPELLDRIIELVVRKDRLKQKIKRIPRRRSLLKKYGLAPEVYGRMLVAQKGECAICRKLPEEGKDLVIDHDHSNGYVRGLLCGRCNMLLGNGRDDIRILGAGIKYLVATKLASCGLELS